MVDLEVTAYNTCEYGDYKLLRWGELTIARIILGTKDVYEEIAFSNSVVNRAITQLEETGAISPLKTGENQNSQTNLHVST